MKVRVLLFAAHREIFGESRLELEVPPETTVATVFDLLTARRPRLGLLKACTTYAVNREVVAPDHKLEPADELAFLQPVSGGIG